MKYSTLVALAVSALASGLAGAATHEAKARPHEIAGSAPLPEVVIRATRVTRAVEGYVNAMSTHDGRKLSKVFTDDAVVEFVNDTPGSNMAVHADSLLDDGTAVASYDGQQPVVTNLHVLPTRDSNTVFVQYDISGTGPDGAIQAQDQLAMIELRGEKVVRMVNFNAPPASLAASRACAAPKSQMSAKQIAPAATLSGLAESTGRF